MATHRIIYRGPRRHAATIASTLADAPGIDLTGQAPVDGNGGDGGDEVGLALTVEATDVDVAAALAALRAALPAGATVAGDA